MESIQLIDSLILFHESNLNRSLKFYLMIFLVQDMRLITKKCPKNQAEAYEASKRIGCGSDKYGNNQYLCLPNEDKASLVEFCKEGVMGLTEKGKFCIWKRGKMNI